MNLIEKIRENEKELMEKELIPIKREFLREKFNLLEKTKDFNCVDKKTMQLGADLVVEYSDFIKKSEEFFKPYLAGAFALHRSFSKQQKDFLTDLKEIKKDIEKNISDYYIREEEKKRLAEQAKKEELEKLRIEEDKKLCKENNIEFDKNRELSIKNEVQNTKLTPTLENEIKENKEIKLNPKKKYKFSIGNKREFIEWLLVRNLENLLKINQSDINKLCKGFELPNGIIAKEEIVLVKKRN